MKPAKHIPAAKMTFHPVAEMFPLMQGAEFDRLVAGDARELAAKACGCNLRKRKEIAARKAAAK